MGRGVVTADRRIREAFFKAMADLVVTDNPNFADMSKLMGVSRQTFGEYIKGFTTPEKNRIEHFKRQCLILVRMCDEILEAYK